MAAKLLIMMGMKHIKVKEVLLMDEQEQQLIHQMFKEVQVLLYLLL